MMREASWSMTVRDTLEVFKLRIGFAIMLSALGGLAISPGPMKTLAAAAIGGARKTYRHTEANAPLRHNATLESVGGAAVFLASDYGACTTGDIIMVDSGYHVLGMPQPDNIG